MEDSADWDAFGAVVTARHCKRAFLDKQVPREVLARVLRAAADAPSTRNTQPWRVAVLSGAARDSLARRLVAEFDSGVPQRQDYVNRLATSDAVIDERAQQAGAGVHQAKGIERADAEARRGHLRDNMNFYGAPVELILHLPREAPHGLFLEAGLFLQNVLLGLVASGLGGCPQYSVAGYGDVIRDELGLGPDRLIVCGVAVGYPDETMPVNGFAPPRAVLPEYVQWHDQRPPTGA